MNGSQDWSSVSPIFTQRSNAHPIGRLGLVKQKYVPYIFYCMLILYFVKAEKEMKAIGYNRLLLVPFRPLLHLLDPHTLLVIIAAVDIDLVDYYIGSE